MRSQYHHIFVDVDSWEILLFRLSGGCYHQYLPGCINIFQVLPLGIQWKPHPFWHLEQFLNGLLCFLIAELYHSAGVLDRDHQVPWPASEHRMPGCPDALKFSWVIIELIIIVPIHIAIFGLYNIIIIFRHTLVMGPNDVPNSTPKNKHLKFNLYIYYIIIYYLIWLNMISIWQWL